VGREFDDLLIRRPVLPADRRVGDAAQRTVDDRVRAPLVDAPRGAGRYWR
jgi:hypothetical protein